MPFEMRLWQVANDRLTPLAGSQLDQEERLETWIARDPSILGMDLAIIGRQVQTEHGGRIDLLALDREGSCIIIELKRGRTPREVVAQLLDYASWVVELDFDRLESFAQSFANKSLATVYEAAFGSSLPEIVNSSHHMILVAAELDASSERIINYLADHHEVSINAVFFNFFATDGKELLGRAWLRDPVETIEQSEAKKAQAVVWLLVRQCRRGRGGPSELGRQSQIRLRWRRAGGKILATAATSSTGREDLRVHEGPRVRWIRRGDQTCSSDSRLRAGRPTAAASRPSASRQARRGQR